MNGWLEGNAGHPEAFRVLAPLISANPHGETIKQRAVGWLKDYPDHPQAYQLLSPLVAGLPTDAEVKERAVGWLDGNPDHPQAYHVLAALVAGLPTDAEVKERAVGWLDRHRDHPQTYELLKALVVAVPTDVEVKQQAVEWLDGHPNHPHAYVLLNALMAALPTDAEVKERAEQWLRANPSHARYHALLSTIIPRTGGAENWLLLGEEYVQRPDAPRRQNVLAVLVTAGKATPHYVELMFDYLDSPANRVTAKQRNFLLYHLSRALARNPQQAVDYLNGPFEESRKRLISVRLVWGLKWLSDYLVAFADTAYPQLGPARAGWILKRLAQENVESEPLNDLLVAWLTANVRRQGYGSLLIALCDRADRWSAIADRLPAQIITDFENLK